MFVSIFLLLILQSNLCNRGSSNRFLPQPISNPVEQGYIHLDGINRDRCSKHFYDQNTLKIKVSFYVKDSLTNSLKLWSRPNITNPATYSKSDLTQVTQTFPALQNCIFTAMPGNRTEFQILIEIV